MNNIKQFIFYFLLLIVPLFQSCNNDDDPVKVPAGEYATGVIIVNEGNFSGSDASVSFLDPATNEVENEIFSKVNGRPLGSVLQSVYFHENVGYLVVNNSNKVEVVVGDTFDSEATIEEGLANPRYMVASGNKGYISNWGNFDENFQLDQSYIAVVDLSNNTITKKINTDNGTERMAIVGNKLYASNNFTNTVSVIDLASETVEATIELASRPNGIVADKQGNVWVLASGSFSGNNGMLFAINPADNSINKEIALNMNTGGKLEINAEGNKLYYTSGKSVYELPVSADAAPTSALLTNEALSGGIYGFAIDPETQNIYVGDALGFKAPGQVYRYKSDGTAIDNFTVGIAPNDFWFK